MEAKLLAVTEIARTPTSKHAPKSINYGWQPFRDVLLIMLDTGMRPAEVFRMRWEHVKWERELIFVPRSKSRKSKRFVRNHGARQGGIAGAQNRRERGLGISIRSCRVGPFRNCAEAIRTGQTIGRFA